ncbi:MAG TPA: 16S rRNA (cytosine(1402)-N(4))-methyltransferase RsmH [Vicinamibacterales bacterium]|nr:16S rRNA (cytosine(1402)-N(4))-methyltransferase RsmH [Vicinamibacterales bacterium]
MTTPGPSRSTGSDARHDPVLLAEVVSTLAPGSGGVYVDGTVGLGGHAAALLEAGAGRVLGIDRDERALEIARERLAGFGDRVELVHADYRQLPDVLARRGLGAVHGVLVDLGVSSLQLDDASRGFSFRQAGPLDMRMDQSRGESLAEKLAAVSEAELADVIYEFGEERKSRRVARAIVEARDRGALTSSTELASVVRRAAGGGEWQRLDPATRTFQALRIWVNGELEGLDAFVEAAVGTLVPQGRLAVIAFHSLEDRVVKRTSRRLAADGVVRLVTRRPIVPGDEEVARNPRARSARLRAMEKVA